MTPKVLIIEDNQNDQKVTSFILKKMGLETIIANNGFDAFESIKKENDTGKGFDLILLDIYMPHMNGITFLRQLHSLYEGKEAPKVIITSGQTDRNDINNCLKLGAKDYLVKPLDPVIVERKVNLLLGNNGEDWAEVKFADQPNYHGTIQFPIRLVSINEVSVTIETSVHLAYDFVTSVRSNFINQDLDMAELTIKIMDCQKVGANYISRGEIIGLNAADSQQLRALLRKIYAEYKERMGQK